MHDPTQKDMAHPDVGTQYRSEIFYETDTQKTRLKKFLKKKIKIWRENSNKYFEN